MSTIRHDFPSVNPSQRMGLAALYAWLLAEGYTQRARETAVRYLASEGTLEGCPEIDVADLDQASEVYCEGLEPVRPCSHEWGSPLGAESRHNPLDDVWNPTDTIRVVADGPDDGDDFDDAPDAWLTRMPGYWEALAADGIAFAPVSGGAPAAEPYEPTESDWADYRAWSDSLDRRDAPGSGLLSPGLSEFLANHAGPLD